MSVDQQTAEWFTGFAETEAAGRSPLYAEFAAGVASDCEFLATLCELPMAKRQPNLLLAAVRHVCGLPDGWPGFRTSYFERREEITEIILQRRVQTNEPARCAPLLPVLAQLPQPLALLEVGAAAGLCLLADRYGYDYRSRTIPPVDRSAAAPTFRCRAGQRTPLPSRPLEVVWRAGLDLHPIDVAEPDAVAWLETLVVFHTAVLAYVPDPEERHWFGDQVASIGARWVSQEGRDVLRPARSASTQPWPSNQYVIAVDRTPVAHSEVHGAWVEWL